MKKARVIEIPEDRPLTMQEYEDYAKHAVNSCIWTLSRWIQSEQQLRDKLRRKGYVDRPVPVEYIGTVFDDDLSGIRHINIIQEAIDTLVSQAYLDDTLTAQNLAKRELQRGKGATAIRKKLMEKQYKKEDIEQALASIDDSEDVAYAVEKAANRYMRSATYRKEQEPFLRKQKLMKRLLTRGFNMSDINTYFDEVYANLDEDE